MDVESGTTTQGHSVSDKDAIARRRVLVAACLHSRLSIRETVDALRREGIEVSKSTVGNDVQAIRSEYKRTYAREYSELVVEELAKFDALERGVMPAAQQGDVDSVHAALRISRERRRLLGLDRPVRIEHTGDGGGPIVTESIEDKRARVREIVENEMDRKRREKAERLGQPIDVVSTVQDVPIDELPGTMVEALMAGGLG